MRSRAVLAIAVACVASLLAGCGGGSGGGTSNPGIRLMLRADTRFSAARSSTRADAALLAPVDAGAVVHVMNFQTGAEIMTGTIDGSGRCQLSDVPSGLSLAIVVNGTRGGKPYRLSVMVPCVTNATTEYVADPVSSIAAEAFCGDANAHNYAANKVFCQEDIQDVLDAARSYVEGHLDDDYSVGGGVIAGTQFGTATSLDSGNAGLAAVRAAVRPIGSDLSTAKNAVSQIEEAGIPLVAMLEPEGLDFRSVFTEQVADNYAAMARGIGRLLLPAISSGGMTIPGSDGGLVATELTVGHAYEVTDQDYEGRLVLRDNGQGAAGQITITYYHLGSGTYTLVARKSGTNWEFTQTFSGDAQQQYKLVISEEAFKDNHSANATCTGTLTCKDSNITTPISFTGTLSATGASEETYTSVTFSGTMTTPEVTSSGQLGVQFLSSKPAGAAEWQALHDFFTSMSISNANIQINLASGSKITMTGSISLTTQMLTNTDEGTVYPVPKRVEMSGTYANTHTGLNYSGDAVFNATWAHGQNGDDVTSSDLQMSGSITKSGHPTYSLTVSGNGSDTSINMNISLAAGVSTLVGSGSATMNAATGDVTGATLTLTSSNGAVFALNRNSAGTISGTIRVGGNQVATITHAAHMLRINFSDNTFKEWPY